MTASTGGLWTFTYGSALSDALYAMTATTTVGGETSPVSPTGTFTLDTNPPIVLVEAPAQTLQLTPTITVMATDPTGFATGATVTLDVDLNNDGNFTDSGETGYATATLVSGVATFTSYPPFTAGHTIELQARVTNNAGTQGTSPTVGVVIGVSPVSVAVRTITTLTNDTGSSTSDHVTSDDRPTISGMAPANALVVVYLCPTEFWSRLLPNSDCKDLGTFSDRFPNCGEFWRTQRTNPRTTR